MAKNAKVDKKVTNLASKKKPLCGAATGQAEAVLQDGVGPCALPVSYREMEDARLVMVLKEMHLLALWQHEMQTHLSGLHAPSSLRHQLLLNSQWVSSGVCIAY